MASVTNTVLQRGEPHFTQSGQRLPDSLHDTDQKISAGLVERLFRYASRAMTDCGFNVEGWECEVYTMDADLPPSDRFYCVEFTNERGGSLGVQGILTERGWPTIDHGLCVAVHRT